MEKTAAQALAEIADIAERWNEDSDLVGAVDAMIEITDVLIAAGYEVYI